MGKLNFVKRCYTCGAVLQSDDKDKEGYIPDELLNSSAGRVLLCEKCYRSENLDNSPVPVEIDKNLVTLLRDAKASDALIVYVIDLFSFEKSFIWEINELIRDCNVLVIANKRDIMPSEANDEDLKAYVAHRLKFEKLKFLDILLASSTENYNIDVVMDRIKELRRRHDVYIIGSKNAGKSAIMNALLASFSNKTNKMIVSDLYPDTDIKVMKLPLDRSTFCYDSPIGLPITTSMKTIVSKETVKYIEMVKKCKRKEFTIYPKQSLALGGLVRLDLLSGKKTALNIFCNDKIEIKRITSFNPDKVFISWLNKRSIKPVCVKHRSINTFDAIDISIEEKAQRDIGIDGFGWISFKGDEQKFRIYVPKGVGVYLSRSKVKC